MISSPCAPQYDYRPNFVSGSADCIAPVYAEHRSRLTAGGCFFRSKNQGPDENLIAVECLSDTFNIYVDGTLVRSYPITLGDGGITGLRNVIAADPDPATVPIEMPAINYDIYDTRTPPEEDALTMVGLETFPLTYLSGGSGGPTTDAGLAAIRTGPERTIFILSTTESATGSDVTPPASKRVQQWNGVEWVSYCNLVAGECPLEGAC